MRTKKLAVEVAIALMFAASLREYRKSLESASEGNREVPLTGPEEVSLLHAARMVRVVRLNVRQRQRLLNLVDSAISQEMPEVLSLEEGLIQSGLMQRFARINKGMITRARNDIIRY